MTEQEEMNELADDYAQPVNDPELRKYARRDFVAGWKANNVAQERRSLGPSA